MGCASNRNPINDVIGNDSCYRIKWDRNDIIKRLIEEFNLMTT